MLVSYNNLKKYVDLSEVSPYELGDLLTNAGLEVEGIRPLAQGSDLKIGYVIESKKHPESDKLSINIVDVKNEQLQIVCGASNVKANQKVIVAMPGCKLDYAKVPVIQKVVLAGVESNGMICSLSELGIAEKFQTQEQIEGIEVLDDKYNVGDEALKALGYDDYILDISLTPNRSDIYSIYALAIEVAGLTKQKVKPVYMNAKCDKDSGYKIEIADEACKSYGLFAFNNVETRDSSQETKIELMALGFKPRFNLVDQGNIAMVTSGNPVHVFDADKLNSKNFKITKGIEKEDFIGLDNHQYKIEKDDLLIINGDEIVAIAGVIGSLSSAIDESSKNIVVESADFDHVSIRNTSRRLDLFSEASIRFSKLINPYTLEFPVAFMKNELDLSCAGATKVNFQEYNPTEIKVTLKRIKSVLGIEISLEESIEILEDLSFDVRREADTIYTIAPSYRKDVTIDLDIIEEIIRVYGYDNIVETLPLQQIDYKPISKIQSISYDVKEILVGLGLNEIISYQLSSKAKLDVFSDKKKYIELSNPLSEDRKYFRDQLLTSMVETLAFNKSYQENNLNLFEVSNVFLDDKEQKMLSIGLLGTFEATPWQRLNIKSDFYVIKGLVFDVMERLGFTYGRYLIKEVEKDHPYMHPTRSAYIMLNNKIIGVFGAIHPKIQIEYKLKDAYVASLNLTTLSENVGKTNKYEKVSLLPSVTRDLSLVIDNKIKANEITKVIKQGNKLIKNVTIFDIYKGEDLPENSYSMAVSLKIEDDKKTLDELQINQTMNNVIENLQKKLNITLRK
ncbi:phenylalanine--tRNA ligase subunit beta [Mycoplasma sp. P36-A1]|uniref:phenylalanine--tRNA ligase subunit beta n=1 Tax=Mycoplasma sp. P36-A1 TaxID=3252900 RepID=UPI003C2F9FBE